jgi:hypothetical protein
MKPEKLNFTLKLSEMVQKQVVKIMNPGGRVGQRRSWLDTKQKDD